MTTLIGIVAGKGEPSVVLASDLQGTSERIEDRGEVVLRKKERGESQKIHVNDAGDLAVCMTGIHDGNYSAFLYDFIHGNINFKEAIEKGNSEALFKLNLDRFNGRMWDNSHVNSLLIATRYDDSPRLWTCWPLGRIEERYFTALGSGSEHAIDYLQSLNYLCSRDVDADWAIDAAIGALKAASKDVYTSGKDIVVVRKKDILKFGDVIRNRHKEAEKEAIREIKDKLK